MRIGRARTRWGRFLLIIVLAMIPAGYWRLETGVKPTLEAMTQAQISVMAMDMINTAINEKVLRDLNFKDFIFYEKNQSGDIVLVQSNNVLLNMVQTEAVKAVSEAIKHLSEYEILIPVGQIMGSKVLAHIGPSIRIKVLPMAYIDAAVYEVFEGMGVNQTKYTVHMKLDTTIKAVVPLVTSEVRMGTDIPLATVILPGRVPSAYLEIP